MKKIISFVSLLGLLLNSFATPLSVIAQDTIDAPVTQEAVITPVDDTAPLPEQSVIDLPSPTPEILSTTTEESTPAPTDEPANTMPPESLPTTPGPPEETPPQAPDDITGSETLTETFIENINLSEVSEINSNVLDSGTITTDKTDYSPSSVVLITGSGFVANKTYTINIVSVDEPPVDFSDQVKADESGNISYAYQLDGNYRPDYVAYMKNGEFIIATATFTDSASDLFHQCANENPTLGSCDWIGSILQNNNSTYTEGMSVPQRLILKGVAATTGNVHTLTFSHQATKGGNHAYDFLTAYNQGNSPALTLNPCDDLNSSDTALCNSLRSSGHTQFPSVPDDPFISADGSTQSRIDAYETAFGNRTVQIYGDAAISSASFSSISHDVADGGDTGDSFISYTLTWTSESSNILIEMAGHLSIGVNPDIINAGWGTNNGAGSVSGGPYHFKLGKIDTDSLGSQDNQIQADDVIIPGRITIIKQAIPEGSTQFNYSATPSPLGNFSLVDDESSTNTKTFSNIALFTTYTVTETPLPTGWTIDSIICTDPTSNSSGDIQTGVATINITEGEDVVCIFNNTLKQGTIELKKVWAGTGGQTTLNIGTTPGGSEIDTQLTGQGGTEPLTTGQNSVNPGTYYLSESGGLDNYTASPLSCFNDLNNDGDNDNEPVVAVGENDSVVVAPDDHIICAYANRRKQGTIIVKKIMIGGTDTFEFTGTPSGTIGTNEGIIQTTVNTGQYTSIETPLSGWELTDLTCSDSVDQNSFGDKDTGIATFNVEYNETVTCTFTNTKYGSISGFKYEDGNQTPLTGWVISLYEGTDLVATQSTTLSGYSFTNLLPGIYSLFEMLQDGWTAISSPPDVELEAGEASDEGNDFINFKNISVTACKKVDTDGNPSTTGDQTNRQGWTVKLLKNGQVNDTRTTGEDGCYTWTNLGPGIYGVTEETLPSRWIPLTETTPNFGTAVSNQNQSFTFINFEKGHISGHKWNDLNGDSDWDIPEEPAIEGWTIYATYPDQSTHSTTTDSSGYYSFSDLGPGQYIVYETPPTGWAQTFPMSSYVINMTSGGDFENKDFGNQMRGTITIIKDSIPNNAQDFAFTSTQLGNFTLDDDSDPAKTNTIVFPNKGYGTYTVTESEVSGWKLTNLVCEGDSDAQVDIDNRTATLTINEPGENITCTFTNTKYGYMQGRKYLDKNLNGRLDWAESGTFQNNWTIRLYDSNWQPKETQLTRILMDPSGGQYRFENLLPGTYYACEVLPVGWQQMGPVLGSHAVNYDNIQVNGSIAVINGSGVPGEGPVCWQSNINGDEFGWLGFGNIQKGHIIVDKVTDPSEDMQSFSFDATGNGYADFTLTDQDPPNDQELLPGIYTISEADVNGWELESASCISSIKDSESVSRLDLDPGETITCTFNNLKLDPKISITKSNNLSGGITAGTTVTYTINIKNDGNVYIYDIDITDILPGGFTYVLGSTTGATTSDPVVAGGKLTWENVGDLGVGEFLTISYQAKTGMDISNGTYINIASCGAKYGKRPETGPYLFAVSQTDFQENIISCRTVSSAVIVGSTQGYGGNLAGQVLGISTELPATGNPTWVLIAAFAALGAGIYLNVYAKKKTKNVKK